MELYRGCVSHARVRPVRHSFAYEVFLVLVDADALPEAFAGLWPFAALNSRTACLTLHEGDYLRGARAAGQSLGAAARDAAAARVPGYAPSASTRVLLLTHLRHFGYSFNPVSIFFLLDGVGAVECVLLEVANTPWDERHIYALPARGMPGVAVSTIAAPEDGSGGGSGSGGGASAPRVPVSPEALALLSAAGAVGPLDVEGLLRRFSPAAAAPPLSLPPRARAASRPRASVRSRPPSPGRAGAAPCTPLQLLRFEWAKSFHVSPFMGMDFGYDWIFSCPALPRSRGAVTGASAPDPTVLLVQSQNVRGGQPVLVTQLALERLGLPSRARLAYLVLVAFPLLTWRIQWWIHYEAARLWAKGAVLYPHPTGASNATVRAVEALATPFMALGSGIAALRARLSRWGVAHRRVNCLGACGGQRPSLSALVRAATL